MVDDVEDEMALRWARLVSDEYSLNNLTPLPGLQNVEHDIVGHPRQGNQQGSAEHRRAVRLYRKDEEFDHPS